MLRVPGLDARPLPLADAPGPGALGRDPRLPANGPYDVRAGRLGATRDGVTQDAYGAGPVQRRLTSLRGVVRSGNSGGPMVDGKGRVVTTIFAATTTGPRGGYGVPNRVTEVLAGAREPGRHRALRPLIAGATVLRPHGQDTRHRREAVRRARPHAGPARARSRSTRATSRSDEHVVTWAVGHLVQLAEPDEYDPKFKKWRMADLPIVPDRFKLVVRDERSRKQMTRHHAAARRDDVETVVNACDAGREGELIFAYLYEKAGAKKPVQRLWLSSMTQTRDQRGVRAPAARRRVRTRSRRRRARARRPTGSWA